MKFPQYFVDEDGVIHTLFNQIQGTFGQQDFKLEDQGQYVTIEIGEWENDGCFRHDYSYVLWESLVALAKKIEG